MEQQPRTNQQIPYELVDTIRKILKKGNTVEIKRERGQIVIVEIQRQVKNKTSITG